MFFEKIALTEVVCLAGDDDEDGDARDYEDDDSEEY